MKNRRSSRVRRSVRTSTRRRTARRQTLSTHPFAPLFFVVIIALLVVVVAKSSYTFVNAVAKGKPSPTPMQVTAEPTVMIQNGSFETDSDANDIPDGWTITSREKSSALSYPRRVCYTGEYTSGVTINNDPAVDSAFGTGKAYDGLCIYVMGWTPYGQTKPYKLSQEIVSSGPAGVTFNFGAAGKTLSTTYPSTATFVILYTDNTSDRVVLTYSANADASVQWVYQAKRVITTKGYKKLTVLLEHTGTYGAGAHWDAVGLIRSIQ